MTYVLKEILKEKKHHDNSQLGINNESILYIDLNLSFMVLFVTLVA